MSLLLLAVPARAALPAGDITTNTIAPLAGWPKISGLLDATNLTPTRAGLAARADLRAGYGINLSSHDGVAVLAADFSLAPALAFGLVVSRDSTGLCAGGLTLGINGSFDAPLIGTVDAFAGDGVAYDFHFHCAANYLFTGLERPFALGHCTLAPGISLANTSTRAGTDIFLGASLRF